MWSSFTRKTLLIIGTAWLFDALDVALLSFIMPMVKTQWHLEATQTGLLSSVTAIGMAFGAILFGKAADHFGRKNVLTASLVLFSLGNLALAFSPNYHWFLVIRFIVGLGLGGELPVAATYLADHFKGTLQSRLLILADSFWAVGWLIASVLAFFFANNLGWRGLLILTAVPVLFALILRSRLTDAPKIATKSPTLKTSLIANFNYQTILLWLTWLMVMFSYYGMFMWLPTILASRGNTLVTGFGYTVLITIAQLPGYFVAAWLMGKIQVRWVFIIYMFGTALSAFAFGQADGIPATILFGSLLSFFNLGAYGTIIALTPVQYLPEYRGTMTGIAQGIGRLGAVIGPLLVGWLLDYHVSVNHIFTIFMMSLFIGALAAVFLPDRLNA